MAFLINLTKDTTIWRLFYEGFFVGSKQKIYSFRDFDLRDSGDWECVLCAEQSRNDATARSVTLLCKYQRKTTFLSAENRVFIADDFDKLDFKS